MKLHLLIPNIQAWMVPCSLRLCVFISLVHAGLPSSQADEGVVPTNLLPSSMSVQTGGSDSFAPVFSPDSKRIVFLSRAKNLVRPNNAELWTDVYSTTPEAGGIELVSQNRFGTGGGNGHSRSPAVSEDARFIAFLSDASDLTEDSPGSGWAQIYFRDCVLKQTVLVTATSDGAGADGESQPPLISRDGRFVVFESTARNLVDQSFFPASRVYVWDRDFRTIRSVAPLERPEWLRRNCRNPSISADGQVIAFETPANNAVTPSNETRGLVYVRDMRRDVPEMMAPPGVRDDATNSTLFSLPSVTPDGGFVTYRSDDAMRSRSGVVLQRLADGVAWALELDILTTNSRSSRLSISTDARYIMAQLSWNSAFLFEADINHPESLNVKNPLRVTQIRRPGEGSDMFAFSDPVMSADGGVTAFSLSARGFNGIELPGAETKLWAFPPEVEPLVPPLTLFALGNITNRLMELVARATEGSLTVSPDGRWIAYDSPARQGGIPDFDQTLDVFVAAISDGRPRLISRKMPSSVPDLSVRGPTLFPASVDRTGSRVLLGEQLGRDSDNEISFKHRDLVLLEVPTGERRVLTPRNLPRPGTTGHSSKLRNTNHVAEAILSRSGKRAVAIISRVDSLPLLPPELNLPRIALFDLQYGTRQDLEVFGYDEIESLVYYPRTRHILSASADLDRLVIPRIGAWPASDLYLLIPRQNVNPILLSGGPNSLIGTGTSISPALSPDGNWAAWLSNSRTVLNRVPASNSLHLVLSDLRVPTLPKHQVILPDAKFGAHEAAWSGDSSTLVFAAADGFTYRIKPPDILPVRVGRQLTNLVVNQNGHYVCGRAIEGDHYPRRYQIHRLDMQSQDEEWVSVAPDGVTLGNLGSSHPQMSSDGSRICFSSEATNLTIEEGPGVTQVFERDMTVKRTRLLSRSANGSHRGNGPSTRPLLADDGSKLFFWSAASDLVSDDFNGVEDLFVVHFSPQDADQDGLPDAWEASHFGTTFVADGATDSDADGASDIQEFQFGTDPQDPASVERVQLSAISPENGVELKWSASPWVEHRIMRSDSLIHPEWTQVGGVIPKFSSSGVSRDRSPVAERNRYYRLERIAP